MKCPNCNHSSDDSLLVSCSECGSAFERGILEELGHLEYLRQWLDELSKQTETASVQSISEKVREKYETLLDEIKEEQAPEEEEAPIVHEIAPEPEVVPLETLEPVSIPEAIKPPVAELKIEPAAPAPTIPKKPPKPSAPPKPKRPPIDWKKVRGRIAEAAASGALLRALLYLSAFMIVVSASVLVIRFWNSFPQILQLVFIAAVPISFYAGGWLLRSKLKLTQAGSVLTGIGAVLVAVDFAAIYQFGGLAEQVNGPIYWLVVSIFCTALYAFSAWKIKGEFFDYLTLISGGSALFTLTRIPRLSMEWSIVSVTISGTIMTVLAGRFWESGVKQHEFARASRYLSQIILPISLLYIIFSPSRPPVEQLTAFLVATVGYGVLAWRFPSLIFAYASLGMSIGAIIFGLLVFDVPMEWYPTTASLFALTYILIGNFLGRAKTESEIAKKYPNALNATGLILVGLAVLGGYIATAFGKTWPAVIALSLTSIDLAFCATLFRKSRYTFLSAGLFVVPFTLAFAQWFSDGDVSQAIGWMTVAWVCLGAAYISMGAWLRKQDLHSDWLFLIGHFFTGVALFALPFDWLTASKEWSNTPALFSLTIGLAVYVASFALQDSGKYPALSKLSTLIPLGLGKAIFLWPMGIVLPIWVATAWNGGNLSRPWLGGVLAGLGLAYLGAGQILSRRVKEYRFPLHTIVYVLSVTGILLAIKNDFATLTALLITTASLIVLATIYNRVVETAIASLLFIWPLTLLFDITKIEIYSRTLGYALSGCIVYTPIAVLLDRSKKFRERYHPIPVFLVGYVLTIYAIIASLSGREAESFRPWIGVTVPLAATVLYAYSGFYFKKFTLSAAWAWASLVTFAIAFGQSLTLFKVPARYDSLAWVGIGFAYMLFERALSFVTEKKKIPDSWSKQFKLPFVTGTFLLSILGLSLSLPDTVTAFLGNQLYDHIAPILAQTLLVILIILFARLHRQGWLLYLEPVLAFLPITLFFIGFGERIFSQPLTTPQYALAWSGLGVVHFIVGVLVDRAKVRYADGLHFGGYALLTWAVLWSIGNRPVLVWTLGLWTLIAIGSAILIHLGKHKTWEGLVQLVFGKSKNALQTTVQNAFIWLASFAIPIWCVLILFHLNIQGEFAWLGLVGPPIIYLGLALWLQRINKTYTYPLHISAQLYTAIALIISTPLTARYLFTSYSPADKTPLVGYFSLQTIAVAFYIASAWRFKTRIFAYISAWLSVIPFTLIWKLYGPSFSEQTLVIPWLIWASILLLLGFWLDNNKIRYAHGLYSAGYALVIFALGSSISDRLSNIYALGVTVFLGTVSYLIVHYGRHKSFEDFMRTFFGKADDTTRKLVATIFLFFVAYAFPVLLTQILVQIEYSLPWRGVALALTAPIYIAIGLGIRKASARSVATVPTWALYSGGYILTAVGAMISFGDERLAIYVLTLNAIVYAASAYIFRQAFWLYLTNVLAPIIALLILHNTDNLNSTNVAWVFTGFAFAYLAIGQAFDRTKRAFENIVKPFAVPFYIPGFALSAIALAISSSDRMLALQTYSVGVIFYALCAWLFRETLFIYPASWLAAVPYYLAITFTSLETRWYGLAWLPLILLYIGVGRYIFHKRPLAPLGKGILLQWLTHPAIPFYLLAYSLSVSMIALSYVSPLSLTLAFATGAILYFASAFLFSTPAWLYISLFSAHMTLIAYFTIDPKGGSAHYLSVPFMGLTWLLALLGYGIRRWKTKADPGSEEEADRVSLLQRLFGNPWSTPFFAYAILDIAVWQSIALRGNDTTIIVASGFALLLALFSLLWFEGLLVYGMVVFGMLGIGAWMHQLEFAFENAIAVYGGIGFGLYLFGMGLKPISERFRALTVWLLPLTHSAIFLSTAAAVINLPFIMRSMTATAAAFAFAGALYVSIAYRGRKYMLGYLGVAFLLAAWVMVLFMNDIAQPQWYAIPGGLYFIGVGFLEWQRNKSKYAIALELLGLGILLVTSFAQSLDGAQGFPYFVLLMFESLLVIWWGVIQKRKIPFFTGIGASVLNIFAQVTVLVNVYNINIWLVGLGVGLLIMGVAVMVELKREQLRERSRELSETLEQWE